jgi:branched-chain amino acid transport system substrate-binding protein
VRGIQHFIAHVAGLLALALAPSVVLAQPIRLANVVELSGPGAVTGNNFHNGVQMALKEVNAAGGVLGRPLESVTLDTQSNPATAKTLVQKAVTDGAFAIFGPVYSGSVLATMDITRQAEVPHFVGGEAAAITQQGSAYVFRTSLTQAIAMPKMARYISERAKLRRLAVVYVNNDFGRGGLEQLKKALAGSPTQVLLELPCEQAQHDFAAIVQKLRQSQADAVFIYTNEDEAPHALKELRRQGWTQPILGETTIIGQKVIEQAGEAANGVIAHVGLPVEVPIPAVRAFKARYEQIYKTTPDHNAMKGYAGIFAFKAAVERANKLDRQAVAQAMKGLRISTYRYPGALMYTEYGQNGDLDRMSFLMEVKDGKQEVLEYLSTLSMGLASRTPLAAPSVPR